MAQRIAERQTADEPTRKWSPRAAEWTVQHELMALFFDRLGRWLAQYANSHRPQGRPPIQPPPPFPRPVTGIDRAMSALEARVEGELEDLIHRAHAQYQQENGG